MHSTSARYDGTRPALVSCTWSSPPHQATGRGTLEPCDWRATAKKNLAHRAATFVPGRNADLSAAFFKKVGSQEPNTHRRALISARLPKFRLAGLDAERARTRACAFPHRTRAY